ncbi:hypothetical protein [Phaeobacter sp. C3_T13_0]|uniref:hypothetical protein n=1 Tax=Phaeobacter cretensis TaxID=3342641 RepID=UPI0039BC5684
MAFQKLKNALEFGAEQKALTLTDPDALAQLGAVPTTSGLSIGPGNAMRVPAVACAVSLISETVGALSVKLYDRDSKEARPITRLTGWCMMRRTSGRARQSCAKS